MSVGIVVLLTTSLVQPQLVVTGARRTPGPQVAPTGSDASMFLHTDCDAPRSYWSGQPTWRSQLASNSARDCVFMATPFSGMSPGGFADASRLYAGASSTSLAILSGCCAA